MMNRLFRSNSSTSLCNRSSSLPEIPQENGTINSEESSWNLKKVFKTDYHVRTIEQVYGLRKPYETCYLFSSKKIKAHKKQGHKFLHIGLVQVGVKPLIREGLNSSILLALRDTRHIRFNDSLLGTIETSLSGGPVHFNCFPNFTVDLHDEHIMKVLTLNIKSYGTLMVHGANQIDMIYRIYYKCCRTNMNIGALDRKKLGETLLIQTNVNAKIQVSTPCYTAKQDSIVDQDDENSQKVESPSGTDMEDPYQDFDLKVLKRDFEPDMDALGKEFNSEKNRVKREAYRANHTREQKVEILNAWKAFMREILDNIPFFEYFENHFEWHKKTCVLTKTNWIKDNTKEVVRSSHPTLAAITLVSEPQCPSQVLQADYIIRYYGSDFGHITCKPMFHSNLPKDTYVHHRYCSSTMTGAVGE
ncbi:hypothetical protein SO802_005540 [Lithocarpus litseifolius]|uniref:DUF7588 domain-containing protein n=1 Tax=Lithocarpus litseifolius TaxID=425828 RepID=A0AAW2DIF6_9ROSI